MGVVINLLNQKTFSINNLTEKELLAVRDALEKQHFAGKLKQDGKNVLSSLNGTIGELIRK